MTVLNIRNSIGTVDCALLDAPNGFPIEVLHFAMRLITIKLRNTKVHDDFTDAPPLSAASLVYVGTTLDLMVTLRYQAPYSGHGATAPGGDI